MRTFYEPLTILSVVSTGLQLVGGISAAGTAKKQARAEAAQAEAQAGQEAISRRRALQDVSEETASYLARARAIYAAEGGDTASGSALAVLEGGSAEGALRAHRVRTDSELRESSLKTLAVNTRRIASSAYTSSLMRTVGAFGVNMASVLRPAPAQAPRPAGSGMFGPR